MAGVYQRFAPYSYAFMRFVTARSWCRTHPEGVHRID